jgi:hypothetical protein
MQVHHDDEYQRPSPHGKLGDGGSDGYHTPTHHCYQCYSPEAFDLKDTQAKLGHDFERAKSKWKHMAGWTFVLNYHKTAAPLIQDLSSLQAKHPELALSIWNRDHIIDQFQALAPSKRERLLGKVRPFTHMEYLTRNTLAAIVARIKPSASTLDHVTNPTPGKLDHNQVNDPWRLQLKVGMVGHPQVQDFFFQASNEQLGTRTGNAIRARYTELEASGLDANECLDRLYEQLYEETDASPGQHHAVLAILAYFFETCDVLEPEPMP